LIASLAGNEELVALEGCEVDDVADLSGANFEKLTDGLSGLVNTGVRAFRNSVYASGGVIGVELISSPLMFPEVSELELLWISDGNVVLFGVLRGWRTGFFCPMMSRLLMVTLHRGSKANSSQVNDLEHKREMLF
jgi:hypothetical protein